VVTSARRLRLAATPIAALLAAAVVAGQQRPVFRSGVEVVVIDVNVVDRATSNPIADLHSEDFTVKVDGKQRAIVSAVYVSHVGSEGSAGKLSADAAGNENVPAESVESKVNDIGRHVLFVFDEDSLEVAAGVTSKRAASEVLDRFGPGESFAAVSIPRLPASISFSSDRADVRKMIERLSPGTPPPYMGEFTIGAWEALEIDTGNSNVFADVVSRECRGSDSTCPIRVKMQAHDMAINSRATAQRSLDALRAVGDALRGLAGPKVIIFVTGGLASPETQSIFGEVEAELAAAQATLYTLYVETSEFSAARRPSPSMFEDHKLERTGIEDVTGAVGGTFIQVVGQVDAGFQQVARELSGTYLLGIEVTPEDRDGAPHHVKVTVNRSGAEVRARSRYVIPAAARANAPLFEPLARPPRTVTTAVLTPELQALLDKSGEYVTECERQMPAVTADESSDQISSRLKLAGSGKGAWSVEKRRRLRADVILVREAGIAGWASYRDVYEVDGKPVRTHEYRLEGLFTGAPGTAREAAAKLNDESAGYEIGFMARNINQPTFPLMFLERVNQQRFSFAKEGEETVGGIPAWRVRFSERESPTFIHDENGEVPVDGVFWLDPENGRVLKTMLRVQQDMVDTEITVTYQGMPGVRGLLAPAEMRESYLASGIKFECVTRYTDLKLLGPGK
jgi:VWFA-related protein